MSIDQLTFEAMSLPPASRASLAESLWESLSDPFEQSLTNDDVAIGLANEREQQMENGSVQPLAHETLMATLRR
jgi:Putative addiction module component